jgi:hypothetical protein
MFPLWKALRRLSGPPVRVYNPSIMHTQAVQCEQADVYPVAFQAADGQVLVTVTNLGEAAGVAVRVDPREVGLPASARLRPLRIDGAASCRADGRWLRTRRLASERFCAALLGERGR